MPTLEAVNSTFVANNPAVASGLRGADAATTLTDDEIASGIVLSVNFELPRLLGRTGSSSSTTFQVIDVEGNFQAFTVDLKKTHTGVIAVDIVGGGASTGGTASFDILLHADGTIRGFDTDGDGIVNSTNTPEIDFTGRGKFVKFGFGDSTLGPLDYGSVSIAATYLELLQGVGLDPLYSPAGNASASTSIITGTSGDDTLTGTSASDTIDGGAGTDTIDYSGESAAVTVDLGAGTATDGSGSVDTLTSIENITGSGFNDTLTGDTGNTVITGGAGVDTIDGGGGGTDTLTGGTGDDTFVIHDGDTVTITDFAAGGTGDVINLTDVAAISNFGQLQAAATDDGSGNTIIDLGGGATLTLTGIASGDLANGDFVF